MPALENLDWERFCQAYLHGDTANNATRSYALVYRTENLDSARAAAARLRQSEPVASRIAELLAEARTDELGRRRRADEALALTRESVLANLKGIGQASVLDDVTIGEDSTSRSSWSMARSRASDSKLGASATAGGQPDNSKQNLTIPDVVRQQLEPRNPEDSTRRYQH